MSESGTMSVDDLIAQASELIGPSDMLLNYLKRSDDGDLRIAACDAFQSHGAADEDAGDVDEGGHFFRVHRWIVETDDQGFRSVIEEGTEDEARKRFETITAELYG